MSAEQAEFYPSDAQSIVLIGGGGGTAAVAPEFIGEVPDARFTIVTGTADSGSATGRLRELYGDPAVGDSRKIMSALSTNEAGELFERRFGPETTQDDVDRLISAIHDATAGYGTDRRYTESVLHGVRDSLAPDVTARDIKGLHGHTVGNFVIAQMMRQGADLGEAVERSSRLVGVEERVSIMPSSTDPHHLVMYDNGVLYRTEGVIDDIEIQNPVDAEAWLEHVDPTKSVGIYGRTRSVVENADLNVLMPASLITSIGATGKVPGFDRALMVNKERGGLLVATANISVERDTRGMQLADYINKLGSLMGREIDLAVVNDLTDGLPEGVVPFKYDASSQTAKAIETITAALVDTAGAEQIDPNDPIKHLRSSVKTSGAAVVRALASRGLLTIAA